MTPVLEEAFEEAVGFSSKKWALVLVAFVAGAGVAVWLIHRAHAGSRRADTLEREPTSIADGNAE